MEVADSIVVMAGGVVEQVGTPDELYERPANDFVMSFLGPVTKLNGTLIRPHDVVLTAEPAPGSVPATVQRAVRLGFEVRVDLVCEGTDPWVQVTREVADRLQLKAGDVRHLAPAQELSPAS